LAPAVAEEILELPLGMLAGHESSSSRSDSDQTPESFQTRNGRQVFGNGGIMPDVTVEAEEMPYRIQNLHRKRAFFDFVVEYVGNDSLAIDPAGATVDDRMLSAFFVFLSRIDSAHTIPDKAPELEALRDLREAKEWSPHVITLIDSLEQEISTEKAAMTEEVEGFIRRGLRKELALRLNGKRASLLIGLDSDVQIRQALELLVSDHDRYTDLLESDGVAR